MEDRIANVEQMLARLEVKADHLDDGMERVLENQERSHVTLQRALHGDLEHPGLVVKTDRLEGWRKRQTKFIATLFTVTLPLALSRGWEIMTGGQ
tara:strand:- start:49596 stop:49880 length:285 start_codon:yes stop_codon:yes gene_type:complete